MVHRSDLESRRQLHTGAWQRVTALLPQGDIPPIPPCPGERRGLIAPRGPGDVCAQSYEPGSQSEFLPLLQRLITTTKHHLGSPVPTRSPAGGEEHSLHSTATPDGDLLPPGRQRQQLCNELLHPCHIN